MKKQMDVYVPKTEYKHQPIVGIQWSDVSETWYTTSTLDLKVIHPEPRVVDLTPTK